MLVPVTKIPVACVGYYIFHSTLLLDSPVHTNSTPVSPSLSLHTGNSVDGHLNYIEAPVSAARTISSPMNAIGSSMNALGSPYRVIASSIGSHSVSLSSSPGMNFVSHTSPQVGNVYCPYIINWVCFNCE